MRKFFKRKFRFNNKNKSQWKEGRVEVVEINNKDYEWLKDFAELIDSASLLKLYDNLNRWDFLNKENLDLIWKTINGLTDEDLFKLINKYQISIIKYFRLWVRLSKIFPYSKYSVFYFIEKHLDSLIDKIEDEEKVECDYFLLSYEFLCDL